MKPTLYFVLLFFALAFAPAFGDEPQGQTLLKKLIA